MLQLRAQPHAELAKTPNQNNCTKGQFCPGLNIRQLFIKGLAWLSGKTQLTSAGRVLSFPVRGSLSVSWSSSRGNAGIATTRSCLQCTRKQKQHRRHFTRSVNQQNDTRGLTVTHTPPPAPAEWLEVDLCKAICTAWTARAQGNSPEPPARASGEAYNPVLCFYPRSSLSCSTPAGN